MKEFAVENEDGQIVVSSRMVAERFGKEHRNVLRKIYRIIDNDGSGKVKEMFIASTYRHKNGLGAQMPEFLITRKGFDVFCSTLINVRQYDEDVMDILTQFNIQEIEQCTKQTPQPTQRPIDEVINITEQDGEILISGRELHEFLEIGTRYDTWFNRMLEYGFVEGQDFTLVAQKRATNNPKNPWTTVTDHALTVDMAKEIAMAQKNAKGKEARQYFIKCEKKLREVVQSAPRLPQTYKEALAELLLEVEAREQLQLEVKAKEEVIQAKEEVIQDLKPKSEYCEQVLRADGAVTITVIAKDYGMSAVKMNALLHDAGIQYKQGNIWLLYAEYADKGYTKSETYVQGTAWGETAIMNTKWTQKGRLFLYDILKEMDIIPISEQ